MHGDSLMDRKENQQYHYTYFFEQEYYGFLEKGDLEEMMKLIHNVPSFTEGHLERSTLSKKFKREMGFNISSYIMRRKLEEAKSMLNYSDKTVSEISEYLCFSSQSYFQNVFKRKYGMTQKDFRSGRKLT